MLSSTFHAESESTFLALNRYVSRSSNALHSFFLRVMQLRPQALWCALYGDCSRENAGTSKHTHYRMASANGCTGDVRNNLAKLLREIQRMKLSVEPNIHGLSLGIPSAFLPIIHCALVQFSVPLANWLASHDYELYAKSDVRFTEGVYKVMRDVFYYHPRLSVNQFLDVGFAERKIIMTTDILRYCQAKHYELIGKPPHHRTRRKVQRATMSLPINEAEILTISKQAHAEDSRSTSACSEHQSPMLDHRTAIHSASPSPDLAPRSLSVSPVEGLGPSPHSSPWKDSVPHTSLPHLRPPLFALRSGNTECVGLTNSKVEQLPVTNETPKVEGLVIRHKDGAQVTKATGLPIHKQEEEAVKVVGVSSPPIGLDQRSKQKSEDGVEDVGVSASPTGLDQRSKEDDVESVVSWQSLPLHERDNQDVKQHPASNCPGDGKEVCSKIDQLTQMVEKLSARFVIFETQMKLIESQREKTASMRHQGHQGGAPSQPEGNEKSSHPCSIPSPSSKEVPRNTSSTPNVSECIPDHTYNSVSSRRHGTAATYLRAQEAGVRDQWMPGAPTQHGTPIKTSVLCPPLSSVGKYTASGWDIGLPTSVVQSPSTPEDTKRLIEGLRQRAKKTKEFLDKATL